MSSSYALLGILDKQPSYGYDLKRIYDRYFGSEKPLAFAQVYSTLARLQGHGEIVSTAIEKDGGPERKRYAITQSGKDDLAAWLVRPEGLSPKSQSILFTKVVTAILVDKSPNDYLDAQRRVHLQRMRELTKMRREENLAQALQADLALFHLEADLRWIDITSARLESLVKELSHAQ